MSESVLVFEDVEHRFGSLTVLSGVSLEVAPGEVLALAGPNGSGKTTLARIGAGLITPTAGSVTRPSTDARQVGYLPQATGFREHATVTETVGFYSRLLSDEPDPSSALDRVGLSSVADRPVHALSGGMRRLLGLAVTILGDPPVIILDEPTSGLDPRMTRVIRELITELAANGRAVLSTTHDLATQPLLDRVAVLDRGNIAAVGSPTELQSRTETDSLVSAFEAIVDSGAGIQPGNGGEGP